MHFLTAALLFMSRAALLLSEEKSYPFIICLQFKMCLSSFLRTDRTVFS